MKIFSRLRLFLCAARSFVLAASCGVTTWFAADIAWGEDLGLSAPPGFTISLFAGDEMAHDIYSMTIDAKGEVVVSGPGYVKTLHDRDGDGHAESATMFSTRPAGGAHGMCFDGADLICTGDNSVMRLHDSDGDGQADGEPEIWANLKNPEHGANGIVQGPDGCFYLICGNDAGVSEKQAVLPGSPVKHPRCGAVVRFSREGKPLDIFAHGFRNPYDLDFNAQGQLFTVDSDGERDYHLPWYAPTRLFDVQQGAEHGWLMFGWDKSWNRPQSFFDSVDRLVEIGRGSPTGLTVYRHTKFPAHYRGGVFSACWTLGRIYFLPLDRWRSGYVSSLETFIESTGANGFAPCDLAVGPEGDLFIAMGGRGTRGSVFRVRAADLPQPQRKPPTTNDAPKPRLATSARFISQLKVLSAPQPLSSWSRAEWIPLAKSLGEDFFRQFLAKPHGTDYEPIRAVEILVELFDGVPIELATTMAARDSREVVARVAWALGRRPVGANEQRLLAELTSRPEDVIARAAWESLASQAALDAELQPAPGWHAGLNSIERRVRSAAVLLASGAGAASYERYRAATPLDQQSLTERLADLQIRHYSSDVGRATPPDSAYWQTCLAALDSDDVKHRLEAIRLLQLGIGDVGLLSGRTDVYAGYVATHPEYLLTAERGKLLERLATILASGQNPEVNREAARLAGMLGGDSAELQSAVSAKWNFDSSTTDDIHYLLVMGQLSGERSPEVTARTATVCISLDSKMAMRSEAQSQNWPLRVGEAFDGACRHDPALAEAVIDHLQFGRPPHTLFVARLPESPLRRRAIEKLLVVAESNNESPSPALVELFGELGSEPAIAYLRSHADDVGIDADVALALAKHPTAKDRPLFLAALSSQRNPVIVSATKALAELRVEPSASDLAAVIDALRETAPRPELAGACRALDGLLAAWAKQDRTPDEAARPAEAAETKSKSKPAANGKAAVTRWTAWFAQQHPAEAKALADRAVAASAGLSERLAKVVWSSGDIERGKIVFERKACNRCHLAAGRLGPDLAGAISRMSKEDLFTAIVDPSREVSPTYATTLIATGRGQIYHGLVVYDSPESMLVQTGLDGVVRITDTAGLTRTSSRRSLMPDGLLKETSDQDLADLYAYLQTLVKP